MPLDRASVKNPMACTCCKSELLGKGALEIIEMETHLAIYGDDADLHDEYLDRLARSDADTFRCWYCFSFGACSGEPGAGPAEIWRTSY